MQRVWHPWRNVIVALGRSQSALCGLRIIVGMDEVMNDSRMVRVLFPQLFQHAGSLKLLRQARIVRRGVTSSQHRERVEGLHFEIVRMLVAKLAHCFFICDHPIAWSHWSMTRLSYRRCDRTVWRVVIDVECSNESALPIRAVVHRHGLF